MAVYQINRKYTITVQKENLDPQWYHISVVPGGAYLEKLKTIFENLPDIQMERFCTSLKSGDVAQLAVICYHSARTVQEWDGYAFDEVNFPKTGDEYEVGLTEKI